VEFHEFAVLLDGPRILADVDVEVVVPPARGSI